MRIGSSVLAACLAAAQARLALDQPASLGRIDHLDPFPERNPVFELPIFFFGVEIISGGIPVHLILHDNIVKEGFAFLGAGRCRSALLQKAGVDRLNGKVDIPIHHNGVVGLDQDSLIPDCFRHTELLIVK